VELKLHPYISFTIKVVVFLEKKLEGLKVIKLEGSKVEGVSGHGFYGLKPKDCGGSSLDPDLKVVAIRGLVKQATPCFTYKTSPERELGVRSSS
jgi:hypothetical protein